MADDIVKYNFTDLYNQKGALRQLHSEINTSFKSKLVSLSPQCSGLAYAKLNTVNFQLELVAKYIKQIVENTIGALEAIENGIKSTDKSTACAVSTST